MKIALAEYDFTAKNLYTGPVQINADWSPTLIEPADVIFDIQLGRTGGTIATSGATYTLYDTITRTVAGNSEIIQGEKQQYVITDTTTYKKKFQLRETVNVGDTIKIYGQSSHSADTEVLGAIWYSVYNDVATTSLMSLAADQAVNMTKIAGVAVSTSIPQIGVSVISQANIDFGALQKASLNAATPASIVGAVNSVTNDVGITQSGADKVWGSTVNISSTLAGNLETDVRAALGMASANLDVQLSSINNKVDDNQCLIISK